MRRSWPRGSPPSPPPIRSVPSTTGELLSPRRMATYGWEGGRGRIFYGIPNTGHAVKAARHPGGRVTPPDEADRRVTAEDEAPVRPFPKSRLPLLDRTPISSMTCTYTNTPDGHFVIDRHPRHRNIWLVSPCSGHGFKFSSVIGE